MKKIGMIGIGLMGHGIACNIVKHGYPLTVLSHPGNQPLDLLTAAGASVCDTPQALAEVSEVIILCVTGTPQVEAVLLGDGGGLKGMRAGTVIIDCSTAIPSSTVATAQVVQAAGGLFLDAPMTRTPKEAAEGRLNLLVGGDSTLFENCKPLLECFAENITHAGPVGAGHRMKLLHNYVSLGSAALLAEAAACAQVAGIDPQVFVNVLATGGGWGAALDRLKPFMTNGDTSGLRFSIANAKKDLSYYNTMASDAHAAQTIARAVLHTLDKAAETASPHTLMPELITMIAARSGSSTG